LGLRSRLRLRRRGLLDRDRDLLLDLRSLRLRLREREVLAIASVISPTAARVDGALAARAAAGWACKLQRQATTAAKLSHVEAFN